MVRPEPTSPVSELVYALREIGSRVRRLPGRKAAGLRARRCRIASPDAPRLNYGQIQLHVANRPIGGEIKLLHLRRIFPEYLDGFNLIYLVSSALPPGVEELVKIARKRGAKLVWNQNGVAYPGCYGDFYPWFNSRMAFLRSQADYVVNQSEFSRISAERYLGESPAPGEILFNPVDTGVFSPRTEPLSDTRWQLLAAGTSHALYRTKSALDTLRVLLARGHDVRLTIAGEFRWKGAEAGVREAMRGLESHVTILPPFRQEEAPEIYRNAHLLLHTKYNDPCPTVPIEAMACGLPVVGTRSGGMPELVPSECGILVPVEQGWVRDLAGDPGLLADAVESVMKDHPTMADASRAHAVRTFDSGPWLRRHGEIFRAVMSR